MPPTHTRAGTASKLIKIRQNSSELVKTRPTRQKLLTLSTGFDDGKFMFQIIRLVKTRENSSKLVRARQKTSELVKTRQNSSISPKTVDLVDDFLCREIHVSDNSTCQNSSKLIKTH